MKQTDGLFHQVFDENCLGMSSENRHWIIDISAAKKWQILRNF
jgi:hypothetical protein